MKAPSTITPIVKGRNTGIAIGKQADTWICTAGNQTIFEIQETGNSFHVRANLFTPASTRITLNDNGLQFSDNDNQTIQINSDKQAGCIDNAAIGLHLYSDGKLVAGQLLPS